MEKMLGKEEDQDLNLNPRNWIDDYPRMAIYRVHTHYLQIRRCPICEGVIELDHDQARAEEREREEATYAK
jgi:hypothetical protein